MKPNKTKQIITGFILAGLLAAPAIVQAQPTDHYAPGAEGLKAATLPPPGVYVRDYNYFYYSDQLNDANGNKVNGANAKLFLYANLPRVIWITDLQVLGGNIGVDALLPLQYTDLKVNTPGGPFNDHTFGIGDLFFEGTWSKHIQQFDFSLGAGVWAPTGDSSSQLTTRAGLGYWDEMLTAGATWYPDQAKRWALSVLNRYEFNQEKRDTDITPGDAYTVEGGLSYGVLKTVDVGAIGYYQQKVTEDSGSGASPTRDRVAGIGPEISAFFPSATFGVSLRYAYEFMAESRFQGHTFTLTLTKRF
ncbi:MAG: transporter [Verrucomicrobiota bacterium]|jgi:hypothetical protein